LPPFSFHNRGNTAIIDRIAAIFDSGHGRMIRGWTLWMLWALVHIDLLNGLERRFLVATQWLVRYVTRQRGARLITAGEFGSSCRRPSQVVETRRHQPEQQAGHV
jgi:NADH dehydrogenase